MKRQEGFSLIELLIVVLIIGILAIIAIPNLLASRRSANEGATISAIRTLHSAQVTYALTKGGSNYAGDTANSTQCLSDLAAVDLIDSVLGSGVKNGYEFVGGQVPSSGVSPAEFWISALPTVTSGVTRTGTRRFGITTQGVIKGDYDLSGHYADSAAVIAATPFSD